MRGQGADMNFLLQNVHVPYKSLFHNFFYLCSKNLILEVILSNLLNKIFFLLHKRKKFIE